MIALWWLGAFVAFGAMISLFMVDNLKGGIFWLTTMLIGAAIMYGAY